MFRTRTVYWNTQKALDFRISRPYVTTYNTEIGNKPFKGFNLLIKQPDIRYLAFEGGGAKGVVYVGVVERLQQQKMLDKVEAVAGSSAGAMQSMLYGLGYSTSQMRDILFQTNMNSFLDISAGQESMNWIQKAWRTALNITTKTDKLGRGVFQGDVLKDWLKDKVKDRILNLYNGVSSGTTKDYLKTLVDKDGEITFSDLETLKTKVSEAQIKKMYFTGTNCTSQQLEVFSPTTSPDMPVYLAARISTSFPWAFKSVIYNGSEYIDGGALNNYPMQVFDNPDNEKYCIGKDGANLETLGVRVDNNQEIMELLWKTPGSEPTGFLNKFKISLGKFFVGVDYITAGRATDVATYEKYPHRTIQVFDKEYSTLNFNLSEQDKQALVESGRTATDTYIKNYLSENTAISIQVEKLEDLTNYVSKDTLEAAVKRHEAELYVRTDLPKLLKDLPFDYFKSETQKTIEAETQKLLESKSSANLEVLEQDVIPKVQDRLYTLLESSLKSEFNKILVKGGYNPAAFSEVIFDVFQYTGPDSLISRTMTNIVNIVDSQGNSYLKNVISAEIAKKNFHDLNQSADDIQKQINQYELEISQSKQEQAKIDADISSIQEKIDTAEQQDKLSLIEQRTELERKIEAERSSREEIKNAKDAAQKEKERRESTDWDTKKETDQQKYEQEMKDKQVAARNQQNGIFEF